MQASSYRSVSGVGCFCRSLPAGERSGGYKSNVCQLLYATDLSHDGNKIVVGSNSLNMPRTRKGTRIYIYDLEDGSIEQVDVGEPVPTQTKSKNASISGDGKLVTFLTTGSFVSSDTNNNASDIYIATPSNVCPVLQ